MEKPGNCRAFFNTFYRRQLIAEPDLGTKNIIPNFVRHTLELETKQIIKGSLTAIILKLLEDNRRMYGYEITKVVREQSKGKMQLTEAALYPALHRLLEDGLLETETEMVEGRMRKYYSLTKKGKTQTAEEVNALKEALASLQLILNSGIAYG
jgi:PadR family transcriptional regulator, regulatory protein PadR